MRRSSARFSALVCSIFLEGALLGCQSDSLTILVHVNNLTPDIRGLEVGARLNGTPAMMRSRFTQNLGQFAVKLAGGSQGQLTVSAAGLADDQCKLSSGSIDTAVAPDTRYVEATLSLVPLSNKLCTLTLVKTGNGTVTSSPPGLDCGATCEADFAVNTTITLTAKNAARPIVAGWGSGCTSSTSYSATNTCALPLPHPLTLPVDLGDGFCSPDGWCWTNPVPQGHDLWAVRGLDVNNIWAVGSRGTVLKWNGRVWFPQVSGTMELLRGVAVSGASDAWAVGNNGTALRWNGMQWKGVASFTNKNLFDVWAVDASNVWATGSSTTVGTLYKFDGAAWGNQDFSGTRFSGFWGTHKSDLWIAGGDALSSHAVTMNWDGMKWSNRDVLGASLQNLGGVWGLDATDVWAAGQNGTLIRWDGTSWAMQMNGVFGNWTGIWGADANNIWTVAEQGKIL